MDTLLTLHSTSKESVFPKISTTTSLTHLANSLNTLTSHLSAKPSLVVSADSESHVTPTRTFSKVAETFPSSRFNSQVTKTVKLYMSRSQTLPLLQVPAKEVDVLLPLRC